VMLARSLSAMRTGYAAGLRGGFLVRHFAVMNLVDPFGLSLACMAHQRLNFPAPCSVVARRLRLVPEAAAIVAPSVITAEEFEVLWSFCREFGRAVVGPRPLCEELCARVLVAGDGLAWLEYLPLAALGAPVGRA